MPMLSCRTVGQLWAPGRLRRSSPFYVARLMSGDEDLVSVIQAVREDHGKRVEIALPGEAQAYHVRKAADGIRRDHARDVREGEALELALPLYKKDTPTARSPGLTTSRGAGIRCSTMKDRVSGAERREYPRTAVECRCWCEASSTVTFLAMLNLSRGGAFLKTAVPIQVGHKVMLRWQLPDEEQVEAVAEIIWSGRGASGPPGMGLRFVEVAGSESLRRFLEPR